MDIVRGNGKAVKIFLLVFISNLGFYVLQSCANRTHRVSQAPQVERALGFRAKPLQSHSPYLYSTAAAP